MSLDRYLDYKRLLPELQYIFDLINSKGGKGYFVGGCIRDFHMGYVANDIDICTTLDVNDLITYFEYEGYRVSKDFLGKYVLVVEKNGHKYEIVTLRKETITDLRTSSQKHFIGIGDLTSDSKRRDFTVNAIYYDPINEEIVDLVGGLKDIEDGKLKFIGDPDLRIMEDPFRILRFYKYLKRGFKPDSASLKACRRNFHLVKDLSSDRLREFIEEITLKWN